MSLFVSQDIAPTAFVSCVIASPKKVTTFPWQDFGMSCRAFDLCQFCHGKIPSSSIELYIVSIHVVAGLDHLQHLFHGEESLQVLSQCKSAKPLLAFPSNESVLLSASSQEYQVKGRGI